VYGLRALAYPFAAKRAAVAMGKQNG